MGADYKAQKTVEYSCNTMIQKPEHKIHIFNCLMIIC